MKATTKNDAFLLLGLLLIAGVVALLLYLTQKKGAEVIVRVSGAQTACLSLDKNQHYQINGVGGINELIIQDGEVWLIDADCPDRLCVKQGKISHEGESIICLPHEVVVELTGENQDEQGPDAVAGRG